MQQRFYFPLQLDDALAVLRRKSRLDQAHGASNHAIVGYTDRATAVLHSRESVNTSTSREVCLVVVEVDDGMLDQLLFGDFTHFGASARRLSDHVMELEHFAQDRLLHEGRFSIEIVSY